ncbi:MAG: hypothetical protein DRZ76_03030, partial [Candidatus Nealsonbacteria bacterium]
QGQEIKELIAKFMKVLGVNTYADLFAALDKDISQRDNFISELTSAKKSQKARFIESIFSGTFGSIDFPKEDFKVIREKLMGMPFVTFVRRMVQYKCSDLIIDALYDPSYRERIIKAGAVIFVGGRAFDMWAVAQRKRVKELLKQDPCLRRHVIFIENHNVFTSWMIQQGVDFGGMLSWDKMEAGPTSYCNAQQNGAPTVATLDGVIPERLKVIKRDEDGKIISGTGYVVEYDQQGKPSLESFVKELEQACKDYYHQSDYGIVSYNALKMGILQGDIKNQAKGLICTWAHQIDKRQSNGFKLYSFNPFFLGFVGLSIMEIISKIASHPVESIIIGAVGVVTLILARKLPSSKKEVNPGPEKAEPLPIEVDIKKVERKGIVIDKAIVGKDSKGKNIEEYRLNTGGLDLDHRKFFWVRRALPHETVSGVRMSKIALFVLNGDGRGIIPVDNNMLVPSGKRTLALEDPRVIERDGTIYVYLTVVKRKPGIIACALRQLDKLRCFVFRKEYTESVDFYSAVTTHNTEEFLTIAEDKINNPKKEVNWNWSKPKRLINCCPYSKQNNKNFVPFGNPTEVGGREYWHALYRPDENNNTTIRLAVSEKGLEGPWKDDGMYMKTPEELGWLGPSTYITGSGAEDIPYDFMLYHRAAADGDIKFKYYDLRLLICDKNSPRRMYCTTPLLVPQPGQPYELDGWIPGTVYSCFASLRPDYNAKKGEYTFDMYYSGSDTVVLLATVTVMIKNISKNAKSFLFLPELKAFTDDDNEYKKDNNYPMDVSPQEQLKTEKQYKEKTLTDIKVSGCNLGHSDSFSSNHYEILSSRLKALNEAASVFPLYWRLVITTDSKVTNGKIAAYDLDSMTVFLHAHFFALSELRQLDILYHELISHLAKRIIDEHKAMEDTMNIRKDILANSGYQERRERQRASEINKLINFDISDITLYGFSLNIVDNICSALASDEYYSKFGKGKGPIKRVEVLDYNGKFGRDVITVRIYYKKEIVTMSLVFYSAGYGLDQNVRDEFMRLGLKFVEKYRNFKIFGYKDEFSKIGLDVDEIIKIIEDTFRKSINVETFEYLDAGGDATVYVNKSRTLVVKELKESDKDIIKTTRGADVLKFLREHGCSDVADRIEKEDAEKGQVEESGPITGYKIARDNLGHLVIRYVILEDLRLKEVKEYDGKVVKNKLIKKAIIEKFVPVLFKQASIEERAKGHEYTGILASAIENGDIETAKLLIDQFLMAVRSIIARGIIDWDIKTENYGYDPSVGHIGSLDMGKFNRWHEVTAEQARVFIRNLQIAASDIYSCTKSEIDEKAAKELKGYFQDKVKEVFRVRDDFCFDTSKDVSELEAVSELEEDLKDLSGHSIDGIPVCYAGSSAARFYSAREVAKYLRKASFARTPRIKYESIANIFAAIGFREISSLQDMFKNLGSDFIYSKIQYSASIGTDCVG